MFSTFTAIFEALSSIEQDLSGEITDSQRQEIIKTLISLRNTMDKCVQYWIKFEERVNQIQERFSISLPDSFPPSFMEDIPSLDYQERANTTEDAQEIVSLHEEDEFLSLTGEGAITSFRKAMGFWGLAMVAEATREFKNVTCQQPNFILGHFCLGVACAQLGQTEEAFKELKLVLALEKDHFIRGMALNTLGVVLAAKEQYQQALPYFVKSSEEEPNLVEPWFNRAAICFNLQHYQEAVKNFNRVFELSPGDWEAELHRGKAYGYLGHYEDALPALERAFAINPREPLITFELAYLYQLLGKKNHARHYGLMTRRLLKPKP
ncbi:MAG TPA: tetratricopeptide repeat protein [Firmicutes bacterium]|nr:tetratricopeptide repeat protein [Bacillota bacterium]